METFLRRSLTATEAMAIALTALFAARATASVAEAIMRRDTSSIAVGIPSRGTRSGDPVPSLPAKAVDDIVRRNVFCGACSPRLPVADSDAEKATGSGRAPLRTALPLQLVVTMVAPAADGRSWSLALIRDTEVNRAGAYRVDMKVRDATVVDIQGTRVFLDHAGRPEFLDLLDGSKAAGVLGAARAGVASSGDRGGDPLAIALERGIKKRGEHAYEVQRGTLDAVLENLGLLSRAVRIVPEVRDGKSVGFRLFGVRNDGLFAAFGLQNGDLVFAINALEVTSPDRVLEAYTKLRSANHLALTLERNGRRVTNDYNIR